MPVWMPACLSAIPARGVPVCSLYFLCACPENNSHTRTRSPARTVRFPAGLPHRLTDRDETQFRVLHNSAADKGAQRIVWVDSGASTGGEWVVGGSRQPTQYLFGFLV
jgi:hypothetical protein